MEILVPDITSETAPDPAPDPERHARYRAALDRQAMLDLKV